MSDPLVSQEEVDALEGGAAADASAQPEEALASGPRPIRAYDMSSEERIVRKPMPAMEIVNERFVRYLKNGIFAFMRRTAEISARPVEVKRYGAFLREVGAPASFNIMAIKPLRGKGLVVCDPVMVSGMVDILYGGSGKSAQTQLDGRDFSPTEQRIIKRLVDVVSTDYARAWAELYPMQLEYQRSEMHPQFANIATANEMVVCAAYDLQIGDLISTIHICLPYASFEPIRDILYASKQTETIRADTRWEKALTREIQLAEVSLVAELAKAEVTVAQLLSMKPGDFIELGKLPRILASIDSIPLFQCQYGTHNGKYALRIEQCLSGADSNWLGENHGN